jgi:hypothetical protein
MKLALTFLLIPFVSFLVSCDPAYRVRRDSDHLDYFLPFDCLTTAVESTSGVKIVQNAISNPRFVCEENQMSHQILYTIDGEPITLTGCYQGNALKTFSQDQSGWVGNKKSVNVPLILKAMREFSFDQVLHPKKPVNRR